MARVSGRPISFQMDLYQPLFVKRPVVEPELFASLRPPTYSGNLEPERRLWKSKKDDAKEEKEPARMPPRAPKAAPGGFGGGGGGRLPAPAKSEEPIDPRQGFHSAV